ncbi:MAG: RNA-binding transcriptional accessory protein [Clostridiales bacterium]|nr:RNA-binding transcriptional accessory protein [Clostridiales bacterium]
MDIIRTLADELKIPLDKTEAAVALLDEGNTIPFIARYRKERTGSMEDKTLRDLSDRLEYLRKLEDRKAEVLDSISSQEKLTPELEQKIASADTLTAVEDLYRPYRPKRRTRASDARDKGLEDLALAIYAQLDSYSPSLNSMADGFINPDKGVETRDDAFSGACDIIAEDVANSAELRGELRVMTWDYGRIHAKKAGDGNPVYAMYDDYSEPVSRIAGHRVLAMNRGENEKALKISIELEDEIALNWLLMKTVSSKASSARKYVEAAVLDSYDRLIKPSIEREIRSTLTDNASTGAIGVFSDNLRGLLMGAPLKGKTVMGFDPGYYNGCKLAVVDETGKVLETTAIYPHSPQKKTDEAAKTMKKLIRDHRIEVIALGNGTASKESEIFISDLLKTIPEEVKYAIVSESGASVWSASEDAGAELPDMDVTRRSAVSIARRLQDPLAELVKIDPKAIGVGQYQHDLPQKELDRALDGVVEDVVNEVGVDVNTASYQLLSHIAGLNSTVAKNIVKKRGDTGGFKSRAELKEVPRLGERTFVQSAGFLRVPESNEILDNTGVHPESYSAAKELLKRFGYTVADVREGRLFELRSKIIAAGAEDIADSLGIGLPTLNDIVGELEKPGRDIRDSLPKPELRADLMDLDSLHPGMTLSGTVRNVTDFGAFIDIGVHTDGLLHVSKFGRTKPEVGQPIRVKVLNVDKERKRIGLDRAD